MIAATKTAPLFWYIYRPGHYVSSEDGGFNVALYGNNTLSYSRFNGAGQVMDECTFQLPPEVLGTYMMILNSQSWWMGKVPLNIRTGGQAQYSCMFGFAGHPMFICEEINTLVQAPFNSQRGMYARRLRGMLECMSEMLYDYGVELGVDKFGWDWKYIRPLEELQATPVQAAQAAQSAQYYSAQQFPQDGAQYYEQQDRMAL